MAKILIIEDSISQAEIIAEVCENSGHQTMVHLDFTKGIHQVLLSFQPEIVLIDLVLLGPDGKPAADGFQICREVKRVSKGKVGVIIVSAKDDSESMEWAMLQGADYYVKKPFVVRELIIAVHSVLLKLRSGKQR